MRTAQPPSRRKGLRSLTSQGHQQFVGDLTDTRQFKSRYLHKRTIGRPRPPSDGAVPRELGVGLIKVRIYMCASVLIGYA
jgi:hypothetical protein